MRVDVTLVTSSCIFGWLDRLLIAVWWSSPQDMGDLFEREMSAVRASLTRGRGLRTSAWPCPSRRHLRRRLARVELCPA